MTIKLWHSADTRSFRALWTLEELELPYELVLVPFPPRVTTPSYLEENPLGTVPFLVDRETRMTESVAICQYLSSRRPAANLSVSPEEPEYGEFLNALVQGEATLTFPQTIVLRYSRFEPPERRNEQVAQDYRQWFFARLRAVSQRLRTSPYIAANRFTVADISVGYALMLARIIGLGDDLPPEVSDYWDRLSQRDGYKRAIAAQQADH